MSGTNTPTIIIIVTVVADTVIYDPLSDEKKLQIPENRIVNKRLRNDRQGRVVTTATLLERVDFVQNPNRKPFKRQTPRVKQYTE